MGQPHTHARRLRTAAIVALTPLTMLAGAGGAGAAQPARSNATPLTPTGRVEGAKSETARLARTDRSLLGRSSSQPVQVVVKLDYDSLSVYGGQIKGLPATAPGVTGRALDRRSTAYRRYSGYVRDREERFLSALDARIPAADAGAPLRDVYGGIALTLPANRVARLLRLPGVVAVQRDELEKPQTDATPSFIGAPTLYGQLGQTAADAGKGVIVGVIDTGAWPEHPSFADPGTLPAPPAKADGTPRTCSFGDNPTTPAADPFVCTDKLIGGQAFLQTYLSDPDRAAEEPYPSPRDSNGHGTHTASTAAGGPVADANLLGISRGAIHGVAPGAHIAMYKVCGILGCFPSDSAAAIGQAIVDGVDVINFSISGSRDPYTNAVDLAFLDAYAAGVVPSTSAGNLGPDAATTQHNGPWELAVGATTSPRTFRSTVALTDAGASLQLSGTTVTGGIAAPLPVVDAASPPYSDPACFGPAPAGLFTGKIVVCRRTGARAEKGYNVKLGGAAGMLLIDPVPNEPVPDNHWIPTVHLGNAEGQELLAFLSSHPGATASWAQGSKTAWQGDRVAPFSSRGPGTDWIKPDLTGPGVQVLAGMTPTPESINLGPPGNLFRLINGTSMASPHVAGAAALLKALHPDWTPGQIMSALRTTAKRGGVTKSDGTTPADAFDAGSGRLDLTRAGDPGLTFDETAADYVASAGTPLSRIDLNTPSVSAPTMPGGITTTRTAKNVTTKSLTFGVTTSAPSGAAIVVSPQRFTVKPGASVKLTIGVAALSVANGQYFGRIDLTQVGGPRTLHLPVAFAKKQGVVSLTQDCTPTSIRITTGRSTCTVTAHSESVSPARYQMASVTGSGLEVTEATGATRLGSRLVAKTGTLSGRRPAAPTIAPSSDPPRYVPLDSLGVPAAAIGDEEAFNVDVPPFVFAGETYTSMGVTSNGYIVAGGADSLDVSPTPQALPDSARPNSVLAPYWTDLDGTGAPGVFAEFVNDGDKQWIVVEWRLKLFGTNSLRTFQAWIRTGDTEDITFAYDAANLPGPPTPGSGLTVGAENAEGVGGAMLAPPQDEVAPTGDLRVSSTAGTPGGTASYTFKVKGVARGSSLVGTEMTTPLVRGITTETDSITVTP